MLNKETTGHNNLSENKQEGLASVSLFFYMIISSTFVLATFDNFLYILSKCMAIYTCLWFNMEAFKNVRLGYIKEKHVTRFFINRITRSEEHTSELQSRGHLVCRL